MTLTDTKTNCLTAVALENKALGYPLKGVHVGGGIHVPMPEQWDGTGTAPPGWTVANQETDVAPDAKTANWTVKLDDSFMTDVVSTSTKLTTQEKTTAATLLSKATATVEVTK